MEHGEENIALVVFTWLAPLSVGAAIPLVMVHGGGTSTTPEWAGLVPLAVGLLALASSLLHLGRPERAVWATVRISSSWLSREVVLFGLFLLCLALAQLPLWESPLGRAADLLAPTATVLGLLSLASTGQVYRLRSRPAWDHWSTTLSFPVEALSSGLLLGIAFAGASADLAGGLAAAVSALSLAAAVALTLVRSLRLHGGGAEHSAAWKLVAGRYRWALALRVAGCAVALLLLPSGSTRGLAWIPAALASLGDRVLFFYGVVPISFSAKQIAMDRGSASGRRLE